MLGINSAWRSMFMNNYSSLSDNYMNNLTFMESNYSGGKNMGEMEESVLEAMKEAGKPVRPGQIAKVLGVESKEVSRAIRNLRKEGKVHIPKRCYYAPT